MQKSEINAVIGIFIATYLYLLYTCFINRKVGIKTNIDYNFDYSNNSS